MFFISFHFVIKFTLYIPYFVIMLVMFIIIGGPYTATRYLHVSGRLVSSEDKEDGVSSEVYHSHISFPASTMTAPKSLSRKKRGPSSFSMNFGTLQK